MEERTELEDIPEFEEFPEFVKTYMCYSLSQQASTITSLNEDELNSFEHGGKIIAPKEILRYDIPLYIFKLLNEQSNKYTHCGALTFVPGTRNIYLPKWMFKQLELEEGDNATLKFAYLRKATFCQIQPQSRDFFEICDPVGRLEYSLDRHFTCITTGDVLPIIYNGKMFEIKILKTEPEEAVSVMEVELETELIFPEEHQDEEDADLGVDISHWQPFIGIGYSLNGKKDELSKDVLNKRLCQKRGIPNFDYIPNWMKFPRLVSKVEGVSELPDNNEFNKIIDVVKSIFEPFSGQGRVLLGKHSITCDDENPRKKLKPQSSGASTSDQPEEMTGTVDKGFNEITDVANSTLEPFTSQGTDTMAKHSITNDDENPRKKRKTEVSGPSTSDQPEEMTGTVDKRFNKTRDVAKPIFAPFADEGRMLLGKHSANSDDETPSKKLKIQIPEPSTSDQPERMTENVDPVLGKERLAKKRAAESVPAEDDQPEPKRALLTEGSRNRREKCSKPTDI